MRIRAFVCLLLCLLLRAAAAAPPLPELPPPVSDFRTYGAGLPLSEFLRVTLGAVLRRPYVLTPAAAADAALVSADLSRVRPADLLPVLREVLEAAGYILRESRGVYIVDKRVAAPADRVAAEGDLLVYSPQHRSVASLASYFALFPRLQFAYGAGISRSSLAPALPASAPTSAGSAASPSSSPGLGSDFSSGATAFSQSTGDPSALVVRGDAAQLAALRAFLSQVDISVPEVVVRAYVLEVQTSRSRQSGVSLALSILDDRLKLSLGSAPSGSDTIRISTGSASVSAVVGALAGDSRVRLVSSPVLRAADGSSASASIGTETPTLGAITTTATGAATQSVAYQSAGVMLTVAPRVFEQSIRLKVSQEVSSFVLTTTGLSATPTKLRRAFVSDVVASPGDIVLLGGLSDAKSSTASSSSFWVFGTDSSEDTSSELVVLLAIERA